MQKMIPSAEGMATPLGITQTLDGPRPERVVLLAENDASGGEPLGHDLSQHCPLRVNYLFFATFAARSSSWCYKQTGLEEP